MESVRRRLCARLREEAGFSIPELLVAAVIGVMVAGAGMLVLQIAARAQPQVADRAAQVQQGRTFIERITRELRQGEAVLSASSSGLTILTYVDQLTCGGQPSPSANFCRITYSCSSSACNRTVRSPDGTGSSPSSTALAGISGPNVFTYQPTMTSPTYIGLKLVYPAEGGDDAVTLDDGVALRNYLAAEE
jgi:hypothetical protein